MQQLKHALATEPGRELALLREALSAPQQLAPDERLWVLVQLSKAAKKADRPEEALRYLRQAQREAGTRPIAQVYASRHLVQLLMDLDRRQEAMTEYTKIAPLLPALAGASGMLDGRLEAAEGWLAGGTVMSSLGQLPEATDLLVRALAVFDTRDGRGNAPGNEYGNEYGNEHVRGQIACLDQIANLYYKGGNLDAALRELQRAIDLAERAGASGSLSRLYMRKGVIESSKGNPEGSYRALIQARKLAQAGGEAFNLAMIATNLSDIALQRKDYRAALRFVEEAMPLVETSGDREALLICRVNKGLALNRLGRVQGWSWSGRRSTSSPSPRANNISRPTCKARWPRSWRSTAHLNKPTLPRWTSSAAPTTCARPATRSALPTRRRATRPTRSSARSNCSSRNSAPTGACSGCGSWQVSSAS
ncbi:tetratricopeptide repeat protein [Pseudoduganella armeniaca]|uniref:tetratricopeptide repeat protein n=1 Tax=Pseudoduganella armeniaca TaxID=2072590 RepID=UPI0011B25720|nr:tetratricopeptide repeat protein [Pseudoduganella armeniaca]